MVQPPSRVPPRQQLLDESSHVPRLRLSGDLALVPPELTSPQSLEDRQRAMLAWQALQATPEQAIADRAEIERLDRAVLLARKQAVAARGQASALQGELTRARQERFANPVVYSLGALALAAAGAWLLQRRRLAALPGEAQPSQLSTSQLNASQLHASQLPASPSAFPPAAELSDDESEFDGSDLGVVGDEADQWIERARVAMPAPQELPGRRA